MLNEELEPLGLRVSSVKTKIQAFNDILDAAFLSVPVCGKDVEVMDRFTDLDRINAFYFSLITFLISLLNHPGLFLFLVLHLIGMYLLCTLHICSLKVPCNSKVSGYLYINLTFLINKSPVFFF